MIDRGKFREFIVIIMRFVSIFVLFLVIVILQTSVTP